MRASMLLQRVAAAGARVPAAVRMPLRAFVRSEATIAANAAGAAKKKPTSAWKVGLGTAAAVGLAAIVGAGIKMSAEPPVPLVAGAGAASTAASAAAGAGVASTAAGVLPAIAPGTKFDAKVRQRLRDVYALVGAGLGATTVTAWLGFQSSRVLSFMARPSAALIMLVPAIGTLIGTMATNKDNVVAKGSWLLAFNACMGLTMSPLLAFGGPLLRRAAAYTAAVMLPLSAIGAVAPSEQFMWMGAPLGMGLSVICVSSFWAAFAPASWGGIGLASNISLYGGLGLFALYTMYDTNKLISSARTKDDVSWDPVNESLDLYLNFLNLFIRILQLLSESQNKSGGVGGGGYLGRAGSTSSSSSSSSSSSGGVSKGGFGRSGGGGGFFGG